MCKYASKNMYTSLERQLYVYGHAKIIVLSLLLFHLSQVCRMRRRTSTDCKKVEGMTVELRYFQSTRVSLHHILFNETNFDQEIFGSIHCLCFHNTVDIARIWLRFSGFTYYYFQSEDMLNLIDITRLLGWWEFVVTTSLQRISFVYKQENIIKEDQ